jgi:uncharacterized protein YjbJ (UPF0337 family)
MATGKEKELRGRARQERGERLGDEQLEAEGREERMAGKARQAGEALREAVDGFREGLAGRDKER